MPPSTMNCDAVMKLESSEARNSTAAAISCGSASRPIGMCTSCRSTLSGSESSSSWAIGESTGPGHSALTRMPSGRTARRARGTAPAPPLGCGVGDPGLGAARHRETGRGVDDRAVLLLQHVAQRRLAAQVHRGQVRLLHPAPVLEVGVQDRPVLHRQDLGVVERDIEAAVGVDRGLEQRIDLLGVGHVHRDEGGVELGGQRRAGLGVDVTDHHLGALVHESPGGRQPDAGSTRR